MKKLFPLLLSLTLLINACKKEVKSPTSITDQLITNEANQFKDLKIPETAKSNTINRKKTSMMSANGTVSQGCVPVLHSQSAQFDKLNVLDPTTDIMYIGSLMDGESIQNGTYKPLFLPSDYVRKPVTYSVSIQGSNGPISKTISPDLASFRNSMQEIMSTNIVGQQPANFTFELEQARSKKEIEMKIKANLKFSTFFSSVGNYDESQTSTRNFYLLKIYQKFFSADISIPSDGNLFNKPANFQGAVAPVYISTIDYGRSAYLLIESSFDSTRVYKSLEASFGFWKIGGGTTITQEQKEVMDNMKISGTVIGGSSTDAAKTIGGMQAFHDYLINSANMGPDSRGEVIAYKLRNAKDHALYVTLINGDYYTSDCSSQLTPIYSYVKYNGGQHLLSTTTAEGSYWRNEGVNFMAYKTAVNNSVAIRNLRPNDQSDNLYTSSFTDGYWTRDFGVIFYAYNTQVSGTIPIYDYTNRSGKDHYCSPNIEGDSYWVRHGVAFYAFPKS
ncbi:thiol-activated cytolysin family protein [Pedobacter sp. PAMC26386]|nr:thiol-activated cytolysin family protein [Pedobacter sp. PAMC26386]